MKELSIEEKAKRYDEAIEKAKKVKDNPFAGYDGSDVISYLFPELKESEDERIRKELIEFVDTNTISVDERHNRWLAWLEKQAQKPAFEMKTPEESLGIDSDTYNKIVDECIYGEQKPAWSKEYENGLSGALWAIKQARTIAKDENDMGNLWYAERWLKTIKDRVQPKAKWSEKDESMRTRCIGILGKCYMGELPTKVEEELNWLKSLRPQNTWKPSDEQIKALNDINLTGSIYYTRQGQELINLYNDLKKLKG